MKLRIPPPFQAVIAAFLMWMAALVLPQLSTPFPGSITVAVVAVLVGITIEVSAVFQFFRRGTTVSPLSPQNTSKLVISGLYKYSRNPMYVGLLFLLIGYAVWLANPLATLVILGFVWTMTEWQIKPEEEALREKFGLDYEDYCAQVRRWF